jgi:cell filamentation protein
MPEGYHYIDPDSVYTDQESGVLYNLGGITDEFELRFFESAAVGKRLLELRHSPLPVKDAGALFAIHKHLFQDVYAWAGKPRTVEISKGGKPFFPIRHFHNAFLYINSLLEDYQTVTAEEQTALAKKLAEILDTVNELHPFREGNGRTQREFLRLLAQEKGYLLELNPPDNADVFEQYMTGTIKADVEMLTDLIAKLLIPVS